MNQTYLARSIRKIGVHKKALLQLLEETCNVGEAILHAFGFMRARHNRKNRVMILANSGRCRKIVDNEMETPQLVLSAKTFGDERKRQRRKRGHVATGKG